MSWAQLTVVSKMDKVCVIMALVFLERETSKSKCINITEYTEFSSGKQRNKSRTLALRLAGRTLNWMVVIGFIKVIFKLRSDR